MDIAALSTYMSMSQLQNDIGFAVLNKAMDTMEVTGEGIQKILEASVTPELGQNIDILI
ncbi:MAG: YjfB family protein, partial [Lachnospiraceae bacterium]|nr:YjfB family protein [Lachnospiraceae bacterium]